MDELVLALTNKGKIEVFKPVAAATLRSMARALLEMADSVMVGPTINPPGPPEAEPNEQEN